MNKKTDFNEMYFLVRKLNVRREVGGCTFLKAIVITVFRLRDGGLGDR
jgi:hypothetical protein